MNDPFSPERKTVRLRKQNLFGSGYAGIECQAFNGVKTPPSRLGCALGLLNWCLRDARPVLARVRPTQAERDEVHRHLEGIAESSTARLCLRNYPRTALSPYVFRGKTRFSDSFLSRCLRRQVGSAPRRCENLVGRPAGWPQAIAMHRRPRRTLSGWVGLIRPTISSRRRRKMWRGYRPPFGPVPSRLPAFEANCEP